MSILDVRVNRSWDQFAACRDMECEAFYPDEEIGEEPSPEVRATCASCIVKSECLTLAMSTPRRDDWGVFGGTTAEDRVILRRARSLGISYDPETLDIESLSAQVRTTDSKLRYARSRESQVEQKRAWRERQRELRKQ